MRLLFILAMLTLSEARQKFLEVTDVYTSWYSSTSKYKKNNVDSNKLENKNTQINKKYSPKDLESEQTSEEREIEEYIKLRGKKDSERYKKTWLDYDNFFKMRENFYEKSNYSDMIPPNAGFIEQFIVGNAFDSKFTKSFYKYYNWTTCDEFGRDVVFHFRDVVNIDWIPFYTWSSLTIQEDVAFNHNFTVPTNKFVTKYKKEMAPYLNKTVDWKQRKLYMQTDLSLLLLAVDKSGEFDGIPYRNMRNENHLDVINLRLKMVGPYLAMMYCEHQYATIMAVSGSVPIKIRSEAAKLMFKGRGYPVKLVKEFEPVQIHSEEAWNVFY